MVSDEARIPHAPSPVGVGSQIVSSTSQLCLSLGLPPSTKMEGQFQHSHLPSLRSIRVIRLQPSIAKQSSLCCSLMEVSLGDFPQYQALSYSWDSQVASHPIVCGGGILPITSNCVGALRQLRHPHEFLALWIDSICLYLDRYRTKYRGNLRLGPLFF